MPTINKAIKILSELYTISTTDKDPDWRGAIRLGIEALKREALFRERVPKKEWSLLPGETEEVKS